MKPWFGGANQTKHTHAAPRFSIVMNVYNGERFLAEALESVLAQTLRDWELICWDDRSVDASASIIQKYKDARIRYFGAARHTGLGHARQMAMQQARGQWLGFLDQDDVWSPTKLQLQGQVIDQHDDERLGLVYCRTIKFDDRGRRWHFDHWYEFEDMPTGELFGLLIVKPCFIAMSSALIRKSVLDQLGSIPDWCVNCPDYWMFLRVARGHNAACVQEPSCGYRVHGANMSKTRKADIYREVLKIFEEWRQAIEPGVYSHRCRVYQTLLGLEQVKSFGTLGAGMKRLIFKGSLPYLLTRPWIKACRHLRRLVY